MTARDVEKGQNGRTSREQRPSTSSLGSGMAPDLRPSSKDEEAGEPADSSEEPNREADSEPTPAGTDPFEVGWEGGDDDPLCPRSMHVGRKWLIVFITCFGSLCV